MLPFASDPPTLRVLFEQSAALLEYKARTSRIVQVTDTADMRLHVSAMLDEMLDKFIVSRTVQQDDIAYATFRRTVDPRRLTCIRCQRSSRGVEARWPV